MGNGSDVPDAEDIEAGGLKGADGCLPPAADALDKNIDLAQALLHPLPSRILGRYLRRIRRALSRALEANGTGACRSDHIARGISQGYNRVIKGRLHISPSHWDRLALSPSTSRRSSSHSSSP